MSAAPGSPVVQAIYAIAVLNSVALAGVLWHHRDRPGAQPLLANVLAGALWAGSGLALMRIDPGPLALALFGLVFLGVGVGTMTLLVFTLEYTGRERLLRPSILAALAIEPLLVVLFTVANPDNLFYTLHDGVVEWGPAFWVHTVYSYAILAVVTALIGEFLYRSRSLYRGQSAALLCGTLAAWLGNVVYLFGPIEVDTSPIGFIATGILYAVAIVRYRLVDVAPIARDRVLDTVTDGIFVVDDADRLVDANPVARSLLTDVDGSPIGSTVDSLLADWPALVERYRTLTATAEPAERELEADGEHYLVKTTPIEDDRDRHVGWLIIVRDVTERKRREAQLERQNERLEEFAGIVSHDLRNPLTVADGYLELARETGDERHFDEIENAHERMETIIDDVLTLARDGRDVTDPTVVELETLAERAWEGVETRDATLAVDPSPPLLADADRLRRLLENLFRNALEHGTDRDDASDLEIRLGPIEGDDDSIEDDGDAPIEGFYVEDDGPGIPPDQRERVFETGYTTGDDGTGFGLSIVQGIAEAHGWSVAATESSTGGARFEFRGVDGAADSSDAASTAESAVDAETASR